MGNFGYRCKHTSRQIASRTHSQELQLAEQVIISETLMRGQARGSGSTEFNSNIEGSRPQERDENTQTWNNHRMDVRKHAGVEWDREHSTSEPNSSGMPLHTENHMVSLTEVHNVVENLMRVAIYKLDDWVSYTVEQIVVEFLNTYDVDRNKRFIQAALRWALNRLLVSILDDSSDIRKSFKVATIYTETAP